ncbi:MAG: hypothetical protein H3C34_26545, partial [Caldilineaceae bacterium]|nr:hypothetical protein [Caldilineaceae bacterium]
FFQGLCAGLAGPTTPAPALQLDRRWLESCHPSIPAAANPAKQIALHLYAHVSLVWADTEAFAGVAADWQSRLLLYAETAAIFATVDEMRGLWSMARFPNFWANGVRGVELTTGTAAASDRLHMLLQRRRIKTMRIAAPGASPAALCAHLLALGEWVALYAARLYQVDPADRVPLAYLGLE